MPKPAGNRFSSTGAPGGRPWPSRGGRRTWAAGAVGLSLVLGACSSSGDDAGATSATTAGPPAPTTTTTIYEVPPIPAESVAEICAGTDVVVGADSRIAALLGPLLQADSSDEADKALLDALSKVKPIIDEATSGYDRMAAALPDTLAADARSVRDATQTFYGAVSAASNMDVLAATVQEAAGFSNEAREAAARLDATTRKTCSKSLYSA